MADRALLAAVNLKSCKGLKLENKHNPAKKETAAVNLKSCKGLKL